MLEQGEHERNCPVCEKKIFEGEEVLSQVVCGDESLCLPPTAKHNESECRVYSFCPEKCLDSFTEAKPECSYTPGWKRFMRKIYQTGKSCGIAGIRPHQLHKC